MANTYQLYTGDGSNRNFSVPFPYLDKAHIQVSIEGVVTTAFTWLNASMLQLTTAPALGDVVDVRRVTPTGASPVDFTDGSVLSEVELDLLAVYSAYVAAEARDYADGSLRSDTKGEWDAVNRKLVHLAPGVAPTDAVNKGQLDFITPNIPVVMATVVAGAEAEITAAVAAGQDAIVTYTTTAKADVAGSVTAAATSATEAALSASHAEAQVAVVDASADAAAGSAALAANYAQLSYINDYGGLAGDPINTDYGSI